MARRLGRAFQIVDDCLDYEGDGSGDGKEIGRDFAEGQMTLPVIFGVVARGRGVRACCWRLARGGRRGV